MTFAILEQSHTFPCRFMIAIDRGRDLKTAQETVKLAKELYASSGGVVVGLDLSGDPNVCMLRPVLTMYI